MIANALKKSSGINYPGLIAAWSAKGKTNDDEDRAILKDLTGNGHDITLNGFAFSEMSGYSGYNYRFNKTSNYTPPERLDVVVSATKISGLFKKLDGTLKQWFGKIYGVDSFCDKEYKIKVSGLQESESLQYAYYVRNVGVEYVDIHEDGIYTIPASTYEGIPSQGWAQFIKYIITEDRNLTIELVPEYPDALVFDGVDDYGSVYNIPKLTDCTFIGKFLITKEKSRNGFYATSTNKAGSSEGFLLLQGDNKDLIRRGDGRSYENMTIPNGILNKPLITANIRNTTTQTLTTYVNSVQGTMNCLGSNKPLGINMTIGSSNTANAKERLLNGAFYSLYVFDRVLSDEEIKSFIRKYIDPEYLLPSEQTTE